MNRFPFRPAARTPGSPILLLATLALAGCATGTAAPSAPASAPTETVAATPPGIHWVRTAAEYRILAELAFEQARTAVERAAASTTGPWAVIVDADETLLDNSTYQLRRARLGLGFTNDTWNEWVREEAAPAVPGAVRFSEAVRALGGIVAVVTNRDDEVCDETRRNLTAVGVHHDVVLCRTPGPSDKAARFAMVAQGTTPAGLPPLTVVAWIGDNVGDFPGGSQALRDADADGLAGFGTRYFVLPNPMYGSWESNPER